MVVRIVPFSCFFVTPKVLGFIGATTIVKQGTVDEIVQGLATGTTHVSILNTGKPKPSRRSKRIYCVKCGSASSHNVLTPATDSFSTINKSAFCYDNGNLADFFAAATVLSTPAKSLICSSSAFKLAINESNACIRACIEEPRTPRLSR